MRIVNPSVELITCGDKPVDLMRKIERCGRVCYKSESKITENSYQGFIERIIKRGHEAVLEHGSVAVYVPFADVAYSQFAADLDAAFGAVRKNMYINHTLKSSGIIFSGNIRAWRDALRVMIATGMQVPVTLSHIFEMYDLLFFDLLKQADIGGHESIILLKESDLTDRVDMGIHVRKTVRFICDRGVSHELVRHRTASFCQESTRYCNYSNADFGREITVIQPPFFGTGSIMCQTWVEATEAAERYYFELLDKGATAQEARAVLPNCLKTEVVMTATLDDWLYFCDLRCAPAAHRQMREVATQARELLDLARFRGADGD